MGAERVRERLDADKVDYRVHRHPRAVTAQEVAAVEHESGWHVAKPVLVVADDQLAMVVVPAAMYVDLEAVRTVLDAGVVRLADEAEFSDRFPDCEVGAEPPFGSLYGMPTLVDERLLQHDTVVFRNGSHSETMVLATDDYRRVAEPRPVRVGVPESG